ncbi:hypothetical protein K7X08_002939 [Anisodus acutangulus]|uniref:Uncharacterized protein n=1 Tax=Anisodus acutangulus TaxID=402998 RepID=A0A9Q1MEG4_9SOLA|nr:hypothetical protein K7X08_002939 [Anisodus acutangulus]
MAGISLRMSLECHAMRVSRPSPFPVSFKFVLIGCHALIGPGPLVCLFSFMCCCCYLKWARPTYYILSSVGHGLPLFSYCLGLEMAFLVYLTVFFLFLSPLLHALDVGHFGQNLANLVGPKAQQILLHRIRL